MAMVCDRLHLQMQLMQQPHTRRHDPSGVLWPDTAQPLKCTAGLGRQWRRTASCMLDNDS